MDGVVEAVSNATSNRCHTHDCNKDGCSVSVRTAAPKKKKMVIIDLDCTELQIPRDRNVATMYSSERKTGKPG